MSAATYEQLLEKVRSLQAQGKLPMWPTDEQRSDWAYGNAVIDNSNVTREMADRAVAAKGHRWSGWLDAWCMDCGVEDATEVCINHHDHGPPYEEMGISEDLCNNGPCYACTPK